MDERAVSAAYLYLLGDTIRAVLAIVNGCVPAPPGLVARPVTDLPSVTYHLVHQPAALTDPRVTGLLDRIRSSRRP